MPHFLAPLLGSRAAGLRLCRGGGDVIAASLETAFDRRSRNRGLLGRARFAPSTALILAPCNLVHTFFMRFPIDILFVDRDGRVLKICRGTPQRRVAGSMRAFATIEMANGASAGRVDVGDVLTIR